MKFLAATTLTRRRQLALSLGLNFITRVPSVFIVLIFLPRMRFGLGGEAFGELLAALALGSAVTFPFAGCALRACRAIGEHHSVGNRDGEARVFRALAEANLFLFLVTVCGVGLYSYARGAEAPLILVSLLPIVTLLLNSTFDATRLAYNEHYITAGLGLVAQIAIYTAAFIFTIFEKNLILAALVFHGPILVASLVGGIVLLRERPYLLTGNSGEVMRTISDGFRLGIADGALMFPVTIGVVLIQAIMPPLTTSWFATLARLFQIVLTPMLLLLVPLASFLRLGWAQSSSSRRNVIAQILLGSSLAYGAVAALGLALLNRYYVAGYLAISSPPSTVVVASVLALLGAITAFKSYAAIANMVLDSRHLADWTIGVVGLSFAVASCVFLVSNAVTSLTVFGFLLAFILVMLACWNARKATGDAVAAPLLKQELGL